MSRMMIESLERRELMSADAPLAGAVAGAAMSFSLNYEEIKEQFTAPLGSDKGSFAAGAASRGVADGTSNTVMFGSAGREASGSGIIAVLIGFKGAQNTEGSSYMEQDNVYKVAGDAAGASLMETEGIFYF